MKHDLVDAFSLMIIPVTLGGKKRLVLAAASPLLFPQPFNHKNPLFVTHNLY
jgi:hypothetical protein